MMNRTPAHPVAAATLLAIAVCMIAPATVTAATLTAASPSTKPTAVQIAGVTTAAERVRGAAVFDDKGGSVGTIDMTGDKFVTIVTPGNRVQMPVNALHKSAKGLAISTSAADIDAAIAASAARQARSSPQAKLPAIAALPAPTPFSYVPKGIDPNAPNRSSIPAALPRPSAQKGQ